MFSATFGYLDEPAINWIQQPLIEDDPGPIEEWLKDKKVKDLEELGNALRLAAQHGYSKSVAYLLDAGALPDLHDVGGCTALLLAARFGHPDVLGLLIRKGCRINKASFRIRATALHWAATNGHEDCIEVLLEAGSNINAQTMLGKTPLMLAARSGHLEAVQTLLKYQSNIYMKDLSGATAFHFAAEEGVTDCLKELLKYGTRVDIKAKNGETPLLQAAKQGQSECVRLLTKYGANPSIDGKAMTPLLWAAEGGHETCVIYLLEAGVHPDEATKKAYEDMNDLAINKGTTSLMLASLNGHLNVLKILKRNNCDLNKCDSEGLSPLHYAISGHNEHCVTYLLKNGPDPDGCFQSGSHVGESPLFHALKLNCLSAIRALLKSNCNIYTGGILHSGEYINVFELVLSKKLFNVILMFFAVGYSVNRIELNSYRNSLTWLMGKDEVLFKTLMNHVITPAKLLQLSRNAIRQCLQYNIGEKILCLQLPVLLQQYIDLSDLDDIT